MATPNTYPSGAGESLGDSFVTSSPLVTTGYVWWVNSATGADAASPRGRDRTRPLATLGQAYTNAAAGDIIVLMDGHAETLTGALTLAKDGLIIVGAGSSGGLPTVKLTNDQAAGSLLVVSSHATQIKNIWFEENAQTCATRRVSIAGDGARLVGCYFQCGATDTGAAVELSGGYPTIRSCTFVSTATALASQPSTGILLDTAISGPVIEDSTFDAGTAGFSGFHAIRNTSAIITGGIITNVTLLRGADVLLDSSGTWNLSGIESDSGALIDWSGSGA